jgi:hypothetical protein
MARDKYIGDVGGDDQQFEPSVVPVKISNHDWSFFSALFKFLIYQTRGGGSISNRRYLAQNFSVVLQGNQVCSNLILLTRKSGV